MRLIDADALQRDLEISPYNDYDDYLRTERLIDDAPTIEEQPKGKWVVHNDYNENCRYGCDQCGNLTNRNSSFCPDCGARMESDV